MNTYNRSLAIAVVIGVLAAFSGREAVAGEVGWFRRTFCKLTWEEVQQVAKTPQAISARVRHHLRFVEDWGDEWASGAEAWERGTGDCEDYAAAVIDLCQAAGFDARMIIFKAEGSAQAHAAATGEIDGRMWISSNGWFEWVRSEDHAARRVARQMAWRFRPVYKMEMGELNRMVAETGGHRGRPELK